MNNVVYMLAAEGGENPGSGSFSVLLPKNYDIFWSLLCFIVILLLFWKLVLPKYTKMLQEREDRIEGGLNRAKAQQAEAKAALEKYNAQLADARAEAAEIREQARERGKQIEAEAKTNAEEESRRIVANGESSWRLPARRLLLSCVPKWARTPSTWRRRFWAASFPTPLRSPPPLMASCPSSTLWHRPESSQL